METKQSKKILVSVKHLKKYFPLNKGFVFSRQVGAVKAVDDVSFDICKGETLGVVGESGCGKSTTGRAILHLEKPTAGEVIMDGQDLAQLNAKQIRRMRPQMQMIFQDSYASLNPRHSIGNIIAEPMKIHTDMKQNDIRSRVMDLLEMVWEKWEVV